MKVICISGKAQHGKDTVAKMLKGILERYGNRVLITHFGDLLKYICKSFFKWDGQKDVKGRSLLQDVGTNNIRSKQPDYWVNFIAQVLSFFPDEWDFVIIPDCRFPNEYEVLKDHEIDTILLRVERPGFKSQLTEEQLNHPSETALDNYNYDYKIINNSTPFDLRKTLECIAPYWFIEKEQRSPFCEIVLAKRHPRYTILVDADDVLENFLESWVHLVNKKFGTSVSVNDIKSWDVAQAFPGLSKDDVFSVLRGDEIWDLVSPIPGSQEVLQKWCISGHKVYVVTATNYRNCKAKFNRILELFPFLDEKQLIIAHSKDMVKGDIRIDDGVHNLVNCDGLKILFTAPHNACIDENDIGAQRANTWKDVDRIVDKFIHEG